MSVSQQYGAKKTCKLFKSFPHLWSYQFLRHDLVQDHVNVGGKLASLYPLTRYQNLLDRMARTWQRQSKKSRTTPPLPHQCHFESSLSNQHWTCIPNYFLPVVREIVYKCTVDIREMGAHQPCLNANSSGDQWLDNGMRIFANRSTYTYSAHKNKDHSRLMPHHLFPMVSGGAFLPSSPASPNNVLGKTHKRGKKTPKHHLCLLLSLTLPGLVTVILLLIRVCLETHWSCS